MFTLGGCFTDQRAVSISPDTFQSNSVLNKKPCLEKLEILRENCHIQKRVDSE